MSRAARSRSASGVEGDGREQAVWPRRATVRASQAPPQIRFRSATRKRGSDACEMLVCASQIRRTCTVPQ
eukprot:8539791-Alexandrium_andersonii.AAC.1